MIGHVLACLADHTGNLIEPASALPALELTLDAHQRRAQAASKVAPPRDSGRLVAKWLRFLADERP